jgi:hypothetical protein
LRHPSLKMAKSIAHFKINEVNESILLPWFFLLHIYKMKFSVFHVSRIRVIILARAIKTVLPVKCLTAQSKKCATESSEFVNIDTVEVCIACVLFLSIYVSLLFIYQQ